MADMLEQTDVQGHENEHLQGKVTFHEPDAGWSAEAYEQKLGEYVAVRGRAPQSVTMHPAPSRIGTSGSRLNRSAPPTENERGVHATEGEVVAHDVRHI